MKKFNNIFKTEKTVIGMIHVAALPGTPKFGGNVKEIINKALAEAEIYKNAGIDGIAIENMHDVPYLKKEVGHEISSLLSIIGYEIKNRTGLPCGVQILAAANKAALAVAKSAGLDFIRAEGFVFGHLADEGYIDSCAGELLRYQKKIGADGISILTDIKKKHSSHAISADIDILETAKAAAFFLSDGLIITGKSTGEAADLEELSILNNHLNIPVIIGSGITLENVETYLPVCDAMIIGSYFKEKGYWANDLDADKVKLFMDKVKNYRLSHGAN
ncbi:MAG: BtpA/SgcQ family protein [Saprospiraceae bacterium]